MAEPNYTPKDCYVYIHRRETDGCAFYVGKGTDKRAWKKDKRNKHWHSIVNKHGYFVEIVQDSMQEWWAFELECQLIAYYDRNNLCNKTDGGEGSIGAKRSLQTRKKLSEIRKTFPNPMTGKSHTPEAIKKMIDAKKGKYSGIKHPRCSISIEKVNLVKELRNTTKMTCKEISNQLCVSYHVVRNIVYLKSWKTV